MENNPKEIVSIIVPVYNTNDYVNTCIESVLKQTYRHWELILVDDGSTDGSLETICNWARNDNRIKVIADGHAGPALARNKAIDAALGEYIYFMDSDDWIEPDTLECMINAMHTHEADIVACGLFFDYPNRTKVVAYAKNELVLNHHEGLDYIITGKLASYLCILLLRRSVVREHYEDIPCFEDYATGYKWFEHARRTVILPTPKYHYIQRQNSILHSYRNDKFMLAIHRQRHEYIQQHQLIDDEANRVNTVRNLLKLAKDFSRKPIATDERIQFVSEIRDELAKYLPVTFSQIGLKRYLRLQLLQHSVKAFIHIV